MLQDYIIWLHYNARCKNITLERSTEYERTFNMYYYLILSSKFEWTRSRDLICHNHWLFRKDKELARVTALNDIGRHTSLLRGGAKNSWNIWRNYLLTYLLTPGSRVLLEKLTGFAANQEIPRILWNPKVHYRTHKRCHLSLSWANSIQSPQPLPTSWRSILILSPSTSWSPQWSLSLRFPHQTPVHTSLFLHTCHIPCPSHSSRFYHPHMIGWGVQNIKLLIM